MKRLVVCFDGTWNTSDNRGSPTNVVRLARMIPADDGFGRKQLVLYDAGVGTGNIVDKIAGGALGEGLEEHVKLGYLFLSQNYEAGDEIYLFGFSRGAFTARSLGGFIGACRGLLKRERLHKLQLAWELYRTPPKERNSFSLFNDVLENVTQGVRIKVIGVWDTVGSLGIPTDVFNTMNRRKYSFHDTNLSPIVEHAFQALAIDEMRGPFGAALWTKPTRPIAKQIVEQTWFAGVHADIGGGYDNSELSDLTLRWMLARTTSNSGLKLDKEKLLYFLPDSFPASDFPGGITAQQLALDRLIQKARGPIHNSLGLYAFSHISPRTRVIGGREPAGSPGPLKHVYRLSGEAGNEGVRESIHWSVLERMNGRDVEGEDTYRPLNIRSAVGHLPTTEMTNELQPGTPWHPP